LQRVFHAGLKWSVNLITFVLQEADLETEISVQRLMGEGVGRLSQIILARKKRKRIAQRKKLNPLLISQGDLKLGLPF
jgi:hypothetical protein